MKLRLARSGDVSGIVDLMARSPLLRGYGFVPVPGRRRIQRALRYDDERLLLAVERDEVIGLAWLITTRALAYATYLQLLLVAEGRQSRGIGAALLARAEELAARAGSRHLILLAKTTNQRARSFYRAHGYRYVGVLPSFAHPRFTEALYVKRVGGRPT
jgi:GNAT superfamily N-acetyltransferase